MVRFLMGEVDVWRKTSPASCGTAKVWAAGTGSRVGQQLLCHGVLAKNMCFFSILTTGINGGHNTVFLRSCHRDLAVVFWTGLAGKPSTTFIPVVDEIPRPPSMGMTLCCRNLDVSWGLVYYSGRSGKDLVNVHVDSQHITFLLSCSYELTLLCTVRPCLTCNCRLDLIPCFTYRKHPLILPDMHQKMYYVYLHFFCIYPQTYAWGWSKTKEARSKRSKGIVFTLKGRSNGFVSLLQCHNATHAQMVNITSNAHNY